MSETSATSGQIADVERAVEHEIIKSGCPATFTLLSDQFAKCRNNVYFFGKLKRKMDAYSFRVVKIVASGGVTHWVWAADKSNVYRYDEVKKGLEGSTFECLDDFWARDANAIFCLATQRSYPLIDKRSFLVETNGKAHDKYYDYRLVPNEKWMPKNTNINDCFAEPNFSTLKKTKRKS